MVFGLDLHLPRWVMWCLFDRLWLCGGSVLGMDCRCRDSG